LLKSAVVTEKGPVPVVKSVFASKSGAAEAVAGTAAKKKAARTTATLIRLLSVFTLDRPPGGTTRFGFFETVNSP
jgi:hypothetical protein